ncbi:hypothetical protein TL16_g10540 [Triparma laevis f. inornata]|uniref:Pseudouridine synthase RsuA/RluA-like domain-containing protein n=1 Tax=Triparma laevis f. inornata TaxID=1714386 RepID=A0A9W7BGT4_9STRA|nr:hypothetical protein TL16_g10540 [Triparma laevis f. inornata]
MADQSFSTSSTSTSTSQHTSQQQQNELDATQFTVINVKSCGLKASNGPWFGKTLIHNLSTEFKTYPKSYYESAITNGLITLDSNKTSPSHTLKTSSLLRHIVHRHEPPVPSLIPLIFESPTLLIVSKPCGLPVHPCGSYNHNSLIPLLSKERKGESLNCIHRLDRLTSGLVIIAKGGETGEKWSCRCLVVSLRQLGAHSRLECVA